jgi:hypothetical protein
MRKKHHGEKINLEMLMDFHILSLPEYETVGLGMPCMDVCAPQQYLNG